MSNGNSRVLVGCSLVHDPRGRIDVLQERDRHRNAYRHEYREAVMRHNKLYFEVQDYEMKVRRLEEQLDLEQQIRRLGEDLELERRVRALEDSFGE